MISIIDTGIGNLASIQRAFTIIGAQTCLISDPAAIHRSDGIVLPGVGAFRDGMDALERQNMIDPLRQAAREGKPILGFCLGMQLLADASEEFGEYDGLGLIPAHVVALKPGPGERVPNIGWCDVDARDGARLFQDIPKSSSFYFAHSYYLECQNFDHIAASIHYGNNEVTVAIEHKNIFGLQCHPEKSQAVGLDVLTRFVTIVEHHKSENT